MAPVVNRIVIYTKKLPEMAAFYTRHFGYEPHQRDGDRIVELRPQSSGLILMLHAAAKGQKEGQSLVKLVFDVEDVEAFCDKARKSGLDLGPIHRADGYAFANGRDPSNNPISVSSRAYAMRRDVRAARAPSGDHA
jgi:predicted enzyme related to lactoylglutathione lyase